MGVALDAAAEAVWAAEAAGKAYTEALDALIPTIEPAGTENSASEEAITSALESVSAARDESLVSRKTLFDAHQGGEAELNRLSVTVPVNPQAGGTPKTPPDGT